MNVAVLWIHNGTNVTHRDGISFSPPDLSHNLTITNASISDSGTYKCFAVGHDDKVEINVSVIEGMMHKHKKICYNYRNKE